MFTLSRGSTLPKLKEDNSQYYHVLVRVTSLYLKEDFSRDYIHHCIEWFNSPCTEGTICKDISHSHNQDMMRGGGGALLICEALLIFPECWLSHL